MDRSDELLSLLRVPVRQRQPKRYKSARPWRAREVYLADGGPQCWYVTYSAELPTYEHFTAADVSALNSRGLLTPSYPGTDVSQYSYYLKPD